MSNNTVNLKGLIENSSISRRLPVGIHTGLSVTTKGLEKTPNGNAYFDIVWKNNEGQYQMRDYTDIKATANPGQTEEEAFTAEITKRSNRLLQILRAYVTDEDIMALGSPTYGKLADYTIKVLQNTKKEVSIKLIYDGKGEYPEAPRYKNANGWITSDPAVTLDYTKWEKENRLTSSNTAAPTGTVVDPDSVL